MKSLFAAITLVLAFGFMQAGAFAALPEAQPENPNVTAGRKAIEAKDFKSAVGKLTKAFQENPTDADAHTMLGYSYRKLGTFRQIDGALPEGSEDRFHSSEHA